jgi:hypothetical protein
MMYHQMIHHGMEADRSSIHRVSASLSGRHVRRSLDEGGSFSEGGRFSVDGRVRQSLGDGGRPGEGGQLAGIAVCLRVSFTA